MTDKPLILLIDDELKILQALKRVLGNEGYEVLSSSIPEDALDLLQGNPVDVIICDQNMPGMKGVEVLKRASRISPDTVRILLTGYSDVNTAISAINESGIYYYFSKPWENEELLRVVGEGIARKREEERKKNVNNEVYGYLSGLLKDMDSLRGNLQETERNLHVRAPEVKKSIWKLPAAIDGKTVLLDNFDLFYLMAEGGSIYAVTLDGRYKCDGTLDALEKKLESNHFFRCHKSYLVNLDKIIEISPWFNGALNLKFKGIPDTISVSRNYAAKLKQQFEL